MMGTEAEMAFSESRCMVKNDKAFLFRITPEHVDRALSERVEQRVFLR